MTVTTSCPTLQRSPTCVKNRSAVLNRKLGELCLGIEPPPDPFLPERNHFFFAAYTIAALGLSLGHRVVDPLVP